MNPQNPNKIPPDISTPDEDYDDSHTDFEDNEDYEESSSADFDEDEDDDGPLVIQVHGHAPARPAAPTTRGRGLRNQPTSEVDEEEEDLGPSKTKVKKQMHELRDLGEELTELSKDQISQLDLPEILHDAVRAMKNMNSFGAQRRQIQYIGKLMRNVDPAPIVAKLDAWKGKSQGHTAYMHQLERWRERLLESDSALTELLAAYPQADAQRLRSLIRNAKKERELNKPPKNFRDIFQVLRDILPEPV